MLIEEYIKKDSNFDILMECDLEFSEPDNESEAMANIEWVLKNEYGLEGLRVVIRSYYGDTINW